MKQLAITLSMLFLASAAFARIGWTPRKFKEAYGKPVEAERLGPNVGRLVFHVEVKNRKFEIEGRFFKQRCACVVYRVIDGGKFPTPMYWELRKSNFGTIKWVEGEISRTGNAEDRHVIWLHKKGNRVLYKVEQGKKQVLAMAVDAYNDYRIAVQKSKKDDDGFPDF